MTASSDEVLALYDEHAPRLFALALRITGDRALAAAVLEEVFRERPLPSEFVQLARLVRDRALSRQIQPAAASVSNVGGVPTPRLLLEEAFFRGRSVAELSRECGLDEQTVRVMLREGLEELKRS